MDGMAEAGLVKVGIWEPLWRFLEYSYYTERSATCKFRFNILKVELQCSVCQRCTAALGVKI